MSSTTPPSLLRATTDLSWPPLDSQQLALQLTGKQHYRSFCLSLVSHSSQQPSPDVILVDLVAVPWRSHGRRFESILEMRRTSLRDVMDVGEVGIPIQTLWFYTLCSSTKSLQIPSPSLFKGEDKTRHSMNQTRIFSFHCFFFLFFPPMTMFDLLKTLSPSSGRQFLRFTLIFFAKALSIIQLSWVSRKAIIMLYARRVGAPVIYLQEKFV